MGCQIVPEETIDAESAYGEQWENSVELPATLPEKKTSSELTIPYGGVQEENIPAWWPELSQFDHVYNYGFFLATAKDGIRNDYYEDGQIITWGGNEIVGTYFDQFQILKWYNTVWSPDYALLNMDGEKLTEAHYQMIQVPFADRYILYTGDVNGFRAQACLYTAAGELLAENSNFYGFVRTADGGYVGLALTGWIGREKDDDGINGYRFVDRNGAAVSDVRYMRADFYENADKKVDFTKDCGSIEISDPQTAYFLLQRLDGIEEIIPLEDVLLRP